MSFIEKTKSLEDLMTITNTASGADGGIGFIKLRDFILEHERRNPNGAICKLVAQMANLCKYTATAEIVEKD